MHNAVQPGLSLLLSTWPRFRYDQLMNLGWKRLIPLGMAVILLNAVVGMVKGQ